MSRIGKKPVPLPANVTVTVAPGSFHAKGPKGEVRVSLSLSVKVTTHQDTRQIVVDAASLAKGDRMQQGTARSLIANAIKGVTDGYERKLQIVGVGYQAKMQGKDLSLAIGFCHPVLMKIPEGLKVEMPLPTQVLIKGADAQKVGDFAATIRRVRPPEPYQGKGIRYDDEVVKKKAGKAAAGSAGAG